MKFTRTLKTSAGFGILALVGIGGAIVGSTLATAAVSEQPPAVIPAPSLTEPVYVQQGDVTVGHIRPEDLSRPREIDAMGVERNPGYPNIGFLVYDELDQLIGYATPRFGFVPLSDVEQYKQDPQAYAVKRAESGAATSTLG